MQENALPIGPLPIEETDFGQEYSLLSALSKLVRDYPLGVGLFKEFIQNADDAEATQIRFVLVEGSTADDTFREPRLRNVSGPSLIIWNDAKFKTPDLQNIQSLGDSQKVRRPSSTGKFGLGFNTCYNITDYPILLTGAGVYLFDPHKTAYQYVDSSRPGKRFSLSKELWVSCSCLIKPFQVVGLSPEDSDYDGTAFRLPLRNDHHNAINGRIKKECVSPDKIRELMVEFTELGPSILLFLKHLLRIEFATVQNETGNISPLLSIDTLNPVDVRAGRDVLNLSLKEDLVSTLKSLESQEAAGVRSCFSHCVRVTTPDRNEDYEWVVSTGLFRGNGDALLKASLGLGEKGEKALPWAGVAGLASRTSDPRPQAIQGQVFCFLPLPDVLGGCRIPVHIHGFFDVDTSRRGLTHEAAATGSIERLRGLWNQQLLQEAVAPAYAELLKKLIQLDPSIDPEAFYELWVDSEQQFPPPLDSLCAALYREVSSLKILKTAAGSWEALNALRLPTQAIQEPLIAEQWVAIPNPEIPKRVLNGFNRVGKPIQRLTPEELRAFLRQESDVNCAVSVAPRRALQNRDWLISLATFALENASDDKLRGLPLLLLSDGTLHSFGFVGHVVYIAGPSERRILANESHRFVDPDFVSQTRLSQAPGCGVLAMTADHLLNEIGSIVAKEEGKEYRQWLPDNAVLPNEDWLIDVLGFLLSQPAPWRPDEKVLLERCLVPDQNRKLWPPGSGKTPLLVSPAVDPRLAHSLRTLNVQLANGGKTLLNSLEQFAERFQKIWHITPGDLVDTLFASQAGWKSTLLQYDPVVLDPILQFLSTNEAIRTLCIGPSNRLNKLRELSIFPTQTGDLVAVGNQKCFIASETAPPQISLPIKLLRPGIWKDLLHKLEVRSLGCRSILQHALIPAVDTLNQEDRLRALEWVRDHFDEALTEAGGEMDEVTSLVKSAKLIVDNNDNLAACNELYAPGDAVIERVLGAQARTPKKQLYWTAWDRWAPFFERLGLNKTPRPQDLALYLESLTKAAKLEGNWSSAERQLISVLQHIVSNWSVLKGGQIDMDNGSKLAFRDFLRSRPWCPPLRGAGLKNLPIAKEPPLQLFSICELYPPALGHLVSSVSYLLPLEQTDSIPNAIREIAPEIISPPVESVVTHFKNVIAHFLAMSSLDSKALRAPLQRIYRFFGRAGRDGSEKRSEGQDTTPSTVIEETQITALRRDFENVPCIYIDAEKRFRLPKDCFREGVSFASPWWSQAAFEDPDVEAGLTLLGRKVRPDIEDLCRLTREIHVTTNGPLNERDAERLIMILRRIEELLPEEGAIPDLMLLDSDLNTVEPYKLFLHDATWLDGMLCEASVHLHHPELPPKLVKRLKLKRLSDHLTKELEGELDYDVNPEFAALCSAIDGLLKTQEFRNGLQRILHKGTPELKPKDPTWLSRIKILPVTFIECSHYIIDGESRLLLAKAEDYFFEQSSSGSDVLFLSQNGADVLYEQTAAALQKLGAPMLSDLSPLSKILQCKPDQIGRVLDKLRIPRLPDFRKTEFENIDDESKSDFFEDDSEQSGEGESDVSQEPESETQRSGENKEGTGSRRSRGTSSGRSDEPDSDDEQTEKDSSETASSYERARGENAETERKNKSSASDSKTGSSGNAGSSEGGWRRSYERRRKAVAGRRDHVSRGRATSYVATENQTKEKQREGDSADDELPINHLVGDSAVGWVIQYERQQGREVTIMAHSNPGYDLLSRGVQHQDRYIEVKGIDGEWEIEGVPISPRQFEFARQKGDQFWLYVVENATDTNLVKIHAIQNPVKLVTQFRFDNGWKSFAVTAPVFVPLVPTPGLHFYYRMDNGPTRVGLIVEVSSGGDRPLLQVEWKNGNRGAIPYDPIRVELLREPPPQR